VIEWVAELKPMWLMGLDWIRVSGFTTVPRQNNYWIMRQLFLPGATVLYDGGQFEIDPFRRPSALLLFFAPVGSLKDKFNTFILKNKLIAKSIEGIFTQKSSLEQLRTMVLVLK
jgi:hypothetical protein